MNIKSKPLLGILATPYISNKFKKNYIYLKNNIVKILKKNNINHIVIPYTANKILLQKYLKNIDGLYLPGSQLGNYYNNIEFRKHFRICKYLFKKIIKINKQERKFPILGICHGYENMILISANIKITNSNVDKMLSAIFADNNYKNKINFTRKGNKYKKLLKKKMVLHNNSLGITPIKFKKNKSLTKKYDILATSLDKNNTEFIDIIKSKKYPFHGFQFHPELYNPELLQPFIQDIKSSFLQKKQKINKSKFKTKKFKTKKFKTKKLKKMKSKTLKCKNYGLSTKRHEKCKFYKV